MTTKETPEILQEHNSISRIFLLTILLFTGLYDHEISVKFSYLSHDG